MRGTPYILGRATYPTPSWRLAWRSYDGRAADRHSYRLRPMAPTPAVGAWPGTPGGGDVLVNDTSDRPVRSLCRGRSRQRARSDGRDRLLISGLRSVCGRDRQMGSAAMPAWCSSATRRVAYRHPHDRCCCSCAHRNGRRSCGLPLDDHSSCATRPRSFVPCVCARSAPPSSSAPLRSVAGCAAGFPRYFDRQAC